MFVLDPAIGAFMRVERDLKIPAGNKTYSVNEGTDEASRKDTGAISIGLRRTATRAATPAPWWPTCIGSSSRAAYFSIRRRRKPAGEASPDVRGQPMAMIIEQAGGKTMAGPVVASWRWSPPQFINARR